MATKRFVVGRTTGGSVPHICIQRDSDGFFWSNGVGFIANGGNPFLNTMTEIFDGFWQYETSFEVWANGLYNVAIYDGTASTDIIIEAYSQTVSGDTQVGFIEASSITSKNAVTALRTDLDAVKKTLSGQEIALGVLSDRIDSFHQVLARKDNTV